MAKKKFNIHFYHSNLSFCCVQYTYDLCESGETMRRHLSKVMKSGDILELEHDKKESWLMESQVSDIINDRKIIVKAPKSALKEPIVSQNQFNITAKKEFGVFKMQARVQEIIDTGSDITILLDVDKAIEQIQRREHFRLPLLKEIEVNLIGDPPVKGVTQNLSAGGIKCVVPYHMRVGAQCRIHMAIEQQEIDLKGKVLECSAMSDLPQHTSLRIQFTDLSAKEQQMLSAYIIKQQGIREAKVKR